MQLKYIEVQTEEYEYIDDHDVILYHGRAFEVLQVLNAEYVDEGIIWTAIGYYIK